MNNSMSFESLTDIIVRSLNCIEPRLTGHANRLACEMALLLDSSSFSKEESCKILWTVLFHDIGLLYHGGETDGIFRGETDPDFSHTTYGALFMKYVSPFPECAQLIRYHHSSMDEIAASGMSEQLKRATRCFRLLDAVDLYCIAHPLVSPLQALALLDGTLYDKEAYGAVRKMLGSVGTEELFSPPLVHQTLLKRLNAITLTPDVQNALLRTLVWSINFRSPYTSLHCTTMVEVSDRLAALCGLDQEDRFAVHTGATLHDLGKIAIPSRILDSPGKLSEQDWKIMKSHVEITESLLRNRVTDEILQIAIRHHERLDGSGYPRGLKGEELTLPQRIVAVADVTSALCEKRSYKASFSLEHAVEILREQAESGKLCSYVTGMFISHASEIWSAARRASERMQVLYEKITQQCRKCG